MKILDKKAVPIDHDLVATIGFFDGVHRGHQYLIKQVISEAKTKDLASAVITFPVHPRKILNQEFQPALLCSYEEKLEKLNQTGVDYCCPIDFTVEFSKMKAKEFMQTVLVEQLRVKTLIIGYDHHFGYNRAECFEDYVRFGKELGIKVLKANEFSVEEDHVSSSAIRLALSEGNVEKASKLLSYNYSITGKIIEGFKVGRTIGFPTANMEVWEKYKVIPALGVYAVHVHVNNQKYDAMLYIGKRPTLYSDEQISLEVNLFNFDGDLYGKSLTTEFLHFVRGDVKFSGIDALKSQIAADKQTVIKILQNIKK